MVFNQRKVVHCGARSEKLATVQVSVGLPEDDACEPSMVMPIDLVIKHCCCSGGKLSFDEVKVRLIEARSYSSLPDKTGRRTVVNETEKLFKRNICTKSLSNQSHDGVLKLSQLPIHIAKTALIDGNIGGVRAHHFLQVTLVTRGFLLENLKFVFPLKIGGAQHKASPDNHPMYFSSKRQHRRTSSRTESLSDRSSVNLVEQLF